MLFIRQFSFSCRALKKIDTTIYRPQIPQSVIDNAGKDVEPGVRPHKLMMVSYVKPVQYVPHFEKKVLREVLGKKYRETKISAPVVVKNTVEMCQKLWTIKHLIRVVPITFPKGIPQGESDIPNTRIDYKTGRVELIQSLDEFTGYQKDMAQTSNQKTLSGSNNNIKNDRPDSTPLVEDGEIFENIPEKFKHKYITGLELRKFQRNMWI